MLLEAALFDPALSATEINHQEAARSSRIRIGHKCHESYDDKLPTDKSKDNFRIQRETRLPPREKKLETRQNEEKEAFVMDTKSSATATG